MNTELNEKLKQIDAIRKSIEKLEAHLKGIETNIADRPALTLESKSNRDVELYFEFLPPLNDLMFTYKSKIQTEINKLESQLNQLIK